MLRIIPSIIILIVLNSLPNFGQSSSTMYHLEGVVPQTYLMNPAIQPKCGFYLGLPGIAPLEIQAGVPFSMRDVISYDAELDSTITFLHPKADLNDFYKKVRKSNLFYTETSFPLVSFGFKKDKTFFAFDLREKINNSLIIPGDLLKFMLELNTDGDEFDFNNLGVNMQVYQELGLNVSHQFSDMLSLGIRGKVLFGLADITTRSSKLNLHTSLEEWRITSDLEVNASLPYTDIYRDEEGDFSLDSIVFDEEGLDAFTEDIPGSLSSLFGNVGFAADFGMVFKPVQPLTLSASMIDLGFIKWSNNVYNIKQNADFVFDGVTIDSIQSENFEEILLDSLTNEFKRSNTNEPYNTSLAGKIYLGAKWQFSPGLSVGVLSRSRLYRGSVYEKLTFSANFFPGKVLATSFSYTIQNYSFDNLGFGFSSKLGPLNMYFIMDNIPINYAKIEGSDIPFPIPHTLKDVNFHLGFNLVFGCNKQKKLMKDKPMLL